MTLTLKIVHKEGCQRAFKNYDLSCPRCQELANGSKPREGWNDNKKAFEARRIEAIRTHFVNGIPKCNQVVCTCFEW